jgi:hypothetical protein
LTKTSCFDTVFSYVDVGDHFFAAGVCRRWRDRYLNYCCKRAAASTWLSDACKTNTTYKSAFMTAARLQLAFECGLDLETYDMRYPDDLASAAFNGRLQLLQWLYEHRCNWPERLMLVNAAGSDSIDMLVWLQTVTAPWTAAVQRQIMMTACVYDALNVVKWFRQTVNTQWPAQLRAAIMLEIASDCRHYYTKRVASWVLASADCCWEQWDCKALAAKQHDTVAGEQLAAELFAIAHQHGCPCTCDAATSST